MSDIEIVTPVRVVVEIYGGVVADVYSDAPIDLVILDHDITDDTNNVSVDGIEVAFYRAATEVDDERCQAVFREVENYEQMLESPLPIAG